MFPPLNGLCASVCYAQIPRPPPPKDDHQSPESKPNSKGCLLRVRTRTSAHWLPVTLRGPELRITALFMHYFWGGRDLAYIIVSPNKSLHTAGKSNSNLSPSPRKDDKNPGSDASSLSSLSLFLQVYTLIYAYMTNQRAGYRRERIRRCT